MSSQAIKFHPLWSGPKRLESLLLGRVELGVQGPWGHAGQGSLAVPTGQPLAPRLPQTTFRAWDGLLCAPC